MNLDRRAGILLHPTSLPGPRGIGSLGDHALRWIDWLQEAGCAVWQVLPLGPTGYGDSPYQSFSSFAGNAMLIDLDRLVVDGLLVRGEITGAPSRRSTRVDFDRLIPWKAGLLELAQERLTVGHPLCADFTEFVHTNRMWLDDYTLFRALKGAFNGRPWYAWPAEVRDRDPAALESARETLAGPIRNFEVRQWLFFRQWSQLRAGARDRGIEIFGDIPLYVAHDSADVWANRHLFALGPDGRALEVAGVPPDYFSDTGQLWGNPIYRWDEHAATGYRWWIDRVAAALRLVDLIRIDHFRGFADYWAVPGDAETAITGEWRDGPGRAVFDALEAELGEIPVIAEDLGDLSPAVFVLRDELELPGMNILQFAFDGDPDNRFLPERIVEQSVAYTGTHDNDTTLGWFRSAEPDERARLRTYSDRPDVNWVLIEMALASKAFLAIAPMQDILDLGGSERMNTPGRAGGNWRWRMRRHALTPDLAARVRELTAETGRLLERPD